MPFVENPYPDRFITFCAYDEPALREGNGPYQFVASVNVPAPTPNEVFKPSSTAPGTLRILVRPEKEQRPTKLSERLGVVRSLFRVSPLVRAGADAEDDDDSKTGFSAAVHQWKAGSSRPRYRLESYDLHAASSIKPADSAPQRPSVKAPRGNMKSLTFAKTLRRLQFEEGNDGELEVLITYECRRLPLVSSRFTVLTTMLSFSKMVQATSPPDLVGITNRFLETFQSLEELYCPLRTMGNLKQIILLQIQHAHLCQFSVFLEAFETQYVQRQMRRFDPRRVELRQWTLKAIMADSHLYRQITTTGKEVVLTSESLLDIVIALGQDHENGKFALLSSEIRGYCKDLTSRWESISGSLDHQLESLRLMREMSQSKNVQILTLLATVFLPLSLAAGVLSMQTRFKDLGDLLYDFFGVVVLLAAAVLFLVLIIFGLSFIGNVDSMFHDIPSYKSVARPVLLATLSITALTFGALVLSSFLVGMFKDVVLGAKILGYGTAVAVCLPPSAAVVLFGVDSIKKLIKLPSRPRPRRRGSSGRNRNDIEKNAAQGDPQVAGAAVVEPAANDEDSENRRHSRPEIHRESPDSKGGVKTALEHKDG